MRVGFVDNLWTKGGEISQMARFNVEFSPEAQTMIEELARRQDTTKAEVLRRAIALEKWFTDTTDRNAKIIVEEPDGRLREILKL